MDMVDYKYGHDGLQRWSWWTTEMDMVDYRGGVGLQRWTWWTTNTDMMDYRDENTELIDFHHPHPERFGRLNIKMKCFI